MGKKQEGAPPPHPHTVIMWVVGVLLTTSVALCGLFFKASAQTTTNIADGNIVSVPGNQNNVTVQAPPRERKQLGGGFGCANSKGVRCSTTTLMTMLAKDSACMAVMMPK
jgi:hypothetical protein